MNTLAERTGFGESSGTFALDVKLVIQNSDGEMTGSPVYGDLVVEYCRR